MSDKKKEKTMHITYNRTTVDIQGKQDEQLSKFFEKFASKLFAKVDDFDFYYKSHLFDNEKNKKYSEQFNQNYVNISAEKRNKIVKCPQCICNDSILKIENYRLTFYGCKYGHITQDKLFDEYDNLQIIDYAKIKCDCGKNQVESSSTFCKCLGCAQLEDNAIYLCRDCLLGKHNQDHTKIEYDEKHYYCDEHAEKFKKYCPICNKDFCDKCEECKVHEILTYDIKEKVKETKNKLSDIKKKIENVRCIVNNLKKYLDSSMNMLDEYYKIVKGTIEKYELFNEPLKNYNHRIVKTIENF